MNHGISLFYYFFDFQYYLIKIENINILVFFLLKKYNSSTVLPNVCNAIVSSILIELGTNLIFYISEKIISCCQNLLSLTVILLFIRVDFRLSPMIIETNLKKNFEIF
jgi:hypothetical protein